MKFQSEIVQEEASLKTFKYSCDIIKMDLIEVSLSQYGARESV